MGPVDPAGKTDRTIKHRRLTTVRQATQNTKKSSSYKPTPVSRERLQSIKFIRTMVARALWYNVALPPDFVANQKETMQRAHPINKKQEAKEKKEKRNNPPRTTPALFPLLGMRRKGSHAARKENDHRVPCAFDESRGRRGIKSRMQKRENETSSSNVRSSSLCYAKAIPTRCDALTPCPRSPKVDSSSTPSTQTASLAAATPWPRPSRPRARRRNPAAKASASAR